MGENPFIGLLGISIAVGFLRYGLKKLLEAKALARVPEGPISGIADGMVHVFGKIEGGEPLISPITKAPCYFFSASATRSVTQNSHHEPIKTVTAWSDSGLRNFYINDGTGRVLVDPAGAEIDTPLTFAATVRSGYKRDTGSVGPEITPEQLSASVTLDFSHGKEWHIHETCLLAGHEYSIIGTCQRNPNPEGAEASNAIGGSATEKTLLISSKRGQRMANELRRKGFMMLAVGVGVMVLAVKLWVTPSEEGRNPHQGGANVPASEGPKNS